MKNKFSIVIFLLLMTGCASHSDYPMSIDPTPINFCKSSQDNSRWGLPEKSWKNALLASAMGQKDTALVFATGGSSRFEYDNSIRGHSIKIERKDVGIVRVRDEIEHCDLTPLGYDKLKIYGQ